MMPQFPPPNTLSLFIIFISAVLSAPAPQSKPTESTTISQPIASGPSMYNGTLSYVCLASSNGICNTATKTSLLPTGSLNPNIDVTLATALANFTIDKALPTTSVKTPIDGALAVANASETVTAALNPSGIPKSLDLGKPQNTTAVNTTDTWEQPQSAKRVNPGPSFFYQEGGMRIDCPTPKSIYDSARRIVGSRTPPGELYPWHISREQWGLVIDSMRRVLKLDAQPVSNNVHRGIMASISTLKSDCRRGCLCDSTARIIPSSQGDAESSNLGLKSGKNAAGRRVFSRPCNSAVNAARCAIIIGCWCTATLLSDVRPGPEYADADINAFARAIDRIPVSIRRAPYNRDWPGWLVDDTRAQHPQQRVRYSLDVFTPPDPENPQYLPMNNGVLAPENVVNRQRDPPLFGPNDQTLYIPPGGPEEQENPSQPHRLRMHSFFSRLRNAQFVPPEEELPPYDPFDPFRHIPGPGGSSGQ
ncbi:hypothetical protein TWF481_005486 [Arthrobotrys musiformis]|uniref:Uncharacterized protein n=1 Tax=Arthrobotrys musiformis TaxID=47236 RepID=A0AAV9WDY8_9PEZI